MKTNEKCFLELIKLLEKKEIWLEQDILFTSISLILSKHIAPIKSSIFSLPRRGVKEKLRLSYSDGEKKDIQKHNKILKEKHAVGRVWSNKQGTQVVCPLGRRGDQKYFYVLSSDLPMNIPDTKVILRFVKAIFSQVTYYVDLERTNSLIYQDDVTNLFNQRKLDFDLEMLVSRFKRTKESFSVLFIDIDHFKLVNDQYGHLVGSKLLKLLAKVLKRNLRESDLIYRYGGDEFVMLIPKADEEVARHIANRLLKKVMDYPFHFDKKHILKLSISIGVAHFPTHAKTKEKVLLIADKMMYQAKTAGRGRVCLPDEFYL